MTWYLAMLAATAAQTAQPTIEDLRQRIWTACVDLPASRQGPDSRASSEQACDARRAPVLRQLRELGQTADQSTRLAALGLIFAWAPPAQARRALADMVRIGRDDRYLPPALEAGYGESRAPDKRQALEQLRQTTKSRAVAGSATYLLASQTLADKSATGSARMLAISRLRSIVRRYADVPTTVLGAGDPPHLGQAAAAVLFRIERLTPGKTLPPMHAMDLQGRAVDDRAFAGTITLIDFWATWCPPCVAAMPTLRQVHARYAGRNFQIVSISGDVTAQQPASFVMRNGIDWPQWRIGPSGRVSAQWSNSSFPNYILVDAQHRIVATDDKLDTVLKQLDAALADPAIRGRRHAGTPRSGRTF